MKKLLIAFIVLLLSGCATTIKATQVNKKPDISVKAFVGTCGTPVESYFLQRLGVKVHRHKKCRGIDDLLSLVWAGDLSQENLDGISILAFSYGAHLSRNDPNASYSIALIKIDSFEQRNIETHIAFYKIKRKQNK